MNEVARLHRPDHGATPVEVYERAVRGAEEMIPRLRERAAITDQLRQLPEETCQDIRRLGLARVLQPAHFGGAEASISAMVDILIPIGAGDGATSWVLAQYIMHNFMLARWPVQAQQDVWGSDPTALLSGILIPMLGKAKKVEGGYSLTGRWPFVSGVNTSDWCMLSGMVEDPAGGPAAERYFVVPTSEVEIIDTWRSIGLKGSSSNDVAVKDLFIPEHRSVGIAELKGGPVPGHATTSAAIFKAPVYMTFGILLSSAVLGMAEFMFEEYLSQMRGRASMMSGKDLSSFATQHLKIGEVSASLQAAEALLRADCAEIMEAAESNRPPSDMERTNYRCNATFAGRLAFEASRVIWDLVGARGAYENSPIGRAYLDLSVASRHVTQNWDINAIEHGRVRVRLPMTNPSL